jgi:transposase InsO family protein
MRLDPNYVVKKLKDNGMDAVRTAKQLGIHKSTVYRWKKRARTLNSGARTFRHTGLARKRTGPKKLRCVISLADQAGIVMLRKSRNACAERMRRNFPQYSTSTIYRFLKRKGLVVGRRKYWRPKLQGTNHMHVRNTTNIGKLQMDVKHVMPYHSGLPYTVFEYAIVDIYSRFKQAMFLPELSADGAAFALKTLLPILPFKADFVQTDNGLEFHGRFTKYLEESSIKHYYIHKSSPNENAVIERSFRTDEDEFYSRRTRNYKNISELSNAYQDYLLYYNTERLHLGINLKTPIEVVAEMVND